MKKVMPMVIDDCQSAFLSDKGLMDNVVMVNEVLEEIRRNQKSGVCFNVDFEKVYDSGAASCSTCFGGWGSTTSGLCGLKGAWCRPPYLLW